MGKIGWFLAYYPRSGQCLLYNRDAGNLERCRGLKDGVDRAWRLGYEPFAPAFFKKCAPCRPGPTEVDAKLRLRRRKRGTGRFRRADVVVFADGRCVMYGNGERPVVADSLAELALKSPGP